MFKVGDRVECLENCDDQFTKGNTYIIDRIVGDRIRVCRDDQGEPNGWMKKYFRLVNRSSEGPIRTVTRREIVPGTYGVVEVNNHDTYPNWALVRVCGVRGVHRELNADELREAAHTFNQLAEALEDKP